MTIRQILLVILASLPAFGADTAAALGEQIRGLTLEASRCYKVRDADLAREDIRFYFTNGLLTFAQPIAGRHVVAVFTAPETTDDAEVLLRPPDRGERSALAAAIGSPNLNEHFRTAVLISTDGTVDELFRRVTSDGAVPQPDLGLLVAGRMNDTVRNLATSFQVRMVGDLINNSAANGLFYAGLATREQRNFDVLFDPTLNEQIIVGEVSGKRTGAFDVWTSFQSLSHRKARTTVEDDIPLEDYHIDTTILPDLTIEARARFTAHPRFRISAALSLELADSLDVTSAIVDGVPAEVYRRESLRSNLIRGSANNPFLIVLPRPFEPGTRHEITIAYRGRLIQPAGNNVYFVAARTNWYPGRSFQFTNFDLTFRLPKSLRVVATGDIVDDKTEGEQRVVRHRTSRPVRMAGFNIGDFDSVSLTRNGIRIDVCANRQVEAALTPRSPQMVVLPSPWAVRGSQRRNEMLTVPSTTPNPRARMSSLAADISSALDWMVPHFGPPPLPALVVSPIPGRFGQGFPGLIYLSTISFLTEKERPHSVQTASQHTFYSEVLAAHETAHQWWGNLVAAATYRDEWLQEALANYTALMVLEKKKGPRALETTLAEYRDELLSMAGEPRARIEATGPITWGQRLRAVEGTDPWRVITYDKGSWILHMLRRRMGDATFLRMLGELRKRYAYHTITTEQFRELAAEFMPTGAPDRKLEGFFDTWVYSTGVPTLELTTRVRGKAPAVELQLTLRQTGVPENYGIDVPVVITLPGQNKTRTEWIQTSSEPVRLDLKLAAAPAKVELAPGLGVLAIVK